MRRVLESLFAHKLLLTLPAFAAVAGTAAFLILQPASYQSSATLWANTNVGTQSPAQTQADIVNQYLKTNSFAMAVADAGPLHTYLNAHPDAAQGGGVRSLLGQSSGPPSDDAIRTYLAAHVTLTLLGPSEVEVAVSGPTPDVAKGTADALLTQLAAAELATKTLALQTQLQLYQTQAQQQSAVYAADLAAVRSYLAAHPNLTTGSTTDPQLAILQARASVDYQTYTAVLGKIEQAQSDLALAQQPKLQAFRVVDAPQTPSSQSLFGKQQLIALAAGLAAGLLAVAVLGAVLVRMDTTIHTASEVESMLGLQAIASTPLSAGG